MLLKGMKYGSVDNERPIKKPVRCAGCGNIIEGVILKITDKKYICYNQECLKLADRPKREW